MVGFPTPRTTVKGQWWSVTSTRRRNKFFGVAVCHRQFDYMLFCTQIPQVRFLIFLFISNKNKPHRLDGVFDANNHGKGIVCPYYPFFVF